jgi:hypothetical protein
LCCEGGHAHATAVGIARNPDKRCEIAASLSEKGYEGWTRERGWDSPCNDVDILSKDYPPCGFNDLVIISNLTKKRQLIRRPPLERQLRFKIEHC